MTIERKSDEELYWALFFLAKASVGAAKMTRSNVEFANTVQFVQGDKAKYTFGVVTDGVRMHAVAFDAALLGRYFTGAKPDGTWRISATKSHITLEPVEDVKYPNWNLIVSQADITAIDKKTTSKKWVQLVNELRINGFTVHKADVSHLLFNLAINNILLSAPLAQDSLCWQKEPFSDWYIYQKDTEQDFKVRPEGWEHWDDREITSRATQALGNTFGGALMFKMANPEQMFGDLVHSLVAIVMPKIVDRTFAMKHPLAAKERVAILAERYADEVYLPQADVVSLLENRFIFR